MKPIKLDFSKMKHVKSDTKTTTLQHPDGHHITLLHSALAPENQKQLSALSKLPVQDETPLEQDELKHKMADGGEVDEYGYPKKSSTPAPTPTPAKNEFKNNGTGIQDTSGYDAYKHAEGGEIKESNPKLEQSRKIPERKAPVSKQNDASRLDQGYGKVIRPESHKETNYGKVIMKAEGGKVARYCMYCGGMAHGGECSNDGRKMYADENDGVVSPNDSAPTQHGASGDWGDDQSKPQAPVSININAQPQQGQPALQPGQPIGPKSPQQPPMVQQSQPGGQPPVQTTAPADQPDQSAQAPKPVQTASASDLGQQNVQGNVPASLHDMLDPMSTDPVALKTQVIDDDMKWQQDLANQHITPKTYHQLFSKNEDGSDRGTLSKIGMIFGTIVGGLGSGLTHQPNVALAMMDKVIAQDLEAQKASKSNAQNFIQLNFQHELQKAQERGIDTNNSLVQQQIKQNAITFSQMQGNRAVLHDQILKVQQLQGKPGYQNALNALAMMSNAVDAKNANLSDVAAAGMAKLNAMGINMAGQSEEQPGERNAPQSPEAATRAASARLRGMSAMNYVTPEQNDKAQAELKMIENKQQANQGALDSFDKVSKSVRLGNRIMNPIQAHRQIDAEWNPMLDKLTKSNEGRVTPITVDMMNGIKPEMTDNEDTTKIKRQKLNEILNSGYSTPVLDSLNLTPSKVAPNQNPKSTKSNQDIRYDTQGQGWTKDANGKVIKVKAK